MAILKKQSNWKNLRFYQKSEVLYQLTAAYCRRFLPPYGDRTVDQMVQAARSCKQNIVEGLADGVTSSEMQLKLLNVARASLQELQEDFHDQLLKNGIGEWDSSNPRYESMLKYCREHNELEDYSSFFDRWTLEEMCNCAITLCHMTDYMMSRYLATLEDAFTREGGIKERMHRERTGYRQQQDERLRYLEAEVKRLQALLAQHGIPF